MKWPWKRSASQGVELAEWDQEVRESEAAKAASGQRDEEIQAVRRQALEIIGTSKKLARENHFGKMLDDALGIGEAKHA